MTSRRKTAVRVLLGLLPFLCIFVLFLVMLQPIELRGGSDDTANVSLIISMGRLRWLEMRATTWQPRVLSDFASSVLLFRLPLWRVLNAAAMAILLWAVTQIAFFGRHASSADNTISATPWTSRKGLAYFLTIAVFVCLGVFLIHPNVITSGSVWVSGSFYYLWPTTAMMIGLMPFLLSLYDRPLPHPRAFAPVCFAFSLCACQTEQAAAVQLGVAALVLVWLRVRHGRIGRLLIAQFAVILVASAVFFYFDFTSVRVTAQPELSLFPAFANFSLIDKVMLGVNVYTTHLLHVSNIIFSVFLTAAGWMAFRRVGANTGNLKRGAGAWRLLLFLPAIWALVNTVPMPWGYTVMTSEQLGGTPGALGFGHAGWLSYLYSVKPMAASPSVGGVVLSVLALLCVLSPLYLLFRVFPDVRDRVLACILYLASFFSGILIGLSPSVWASESRPNYISNVLLLLLLAMLLRASLRSPDESAVPESGETAQPRLLPFSHKWPAVVAALVLAIFVLYVIILYFSTFATNIYWWY